jgi:hypothetical protein
MKPNLIKAQIAIDWFPTSSWDPKGQPRDFSELGRVGFCLDSERLVWICRANMNTGTGRYYLADNEMHQWLLATNPNYFREVELGKQWFEDQHVRYSLNSRQDRCAFVLNFRNASLAMLFKLRWFNDYN